MVMRLQFLLQLLHPPGVGNAERALHVAILAHDFLQQWRHGTEMKYGYEATFIVPARPTVGDFRREHPESPLPQHGFGPVWIQRTTLSTHDRKEFPVRALVNVHRMSPETPRT